MQMLDLCFVHANDPLQRMHLKVEGAGQDVDHCLNKSMNLLDLCYLRAGGPLQGVHLQVEGAGRTQIIFKLIHAHV
jgi:hypothetical protein